MPDSNIPNPLTSDDCAFCAISSANPHTTPPSTTSDSYTILSTPKALAFLDIYPLSPCHILLVPRRHAEMICNLTPTENAAIGAWMPVLTKAALMVTGWDNFNVVANNGVYAKQVVPHVHYHIIPKPDHRQREEYVKKFPVPEDAPAIYKAPFGLGVREELDEDIGKKLAEALRVEMAKITKELGGVEMIEGPISREKL